MEVEVSTKDQANSTNSTAKTWIQAYSEISGKELPMEIVMKKISQISIEEDKEMNSTINDSMMIPIIPFERQIFEMVDAESGDLISNEMVPTFLAFMKEDHTLIEKMTILEVISNFRRAHYIRRLYKEGLLDIIRPWVSFEANPEAEALTEATLSFLLEMWITKSLISNYSFNIGKAIVKVRKNGNETNKQLAEKVQKHWTEILQAEEKQETHNRNASTSVQTMDEEYISKDSVALHTRSRRPIINEEDLDYRKRLRMATKEKEVSEEEKKKKLWKIRNRRIDRRNKFNIKRHQSNNRCNIRLSIRLNYIDDCAYIRTPRNDVLSESMDQYTPSTHPEVINYIAYFAGSFIGKVHFFSNPFIIPNDISIDPSIRGMKLSHRDITRVLEYLETGYCGNIVKSLYVY